MVWELSGTVALLLGAGAGETIAYTIATGATGLSGAGEPGGVTALSIARAGYEAAQRIHARTPKREAALWQQLKQRVEDRSTVLRLLQQQRRPDPRLAHAVRYGNQAGCRALLTLPPNGAGCDPAAHVAVADSEPSAAGTGNRGTQLVNTVSTDASKDSTCID